MYVTIYTRPEGNHSVVDITHARQQDAEWFEKNNVSVSMEDTGSDFILYADIGMKNVDGEPEEIIIFAGQDDCYDAMTRLREECEAVMLETV